MDVQCCHTVLPFLTNVAIFERHIYLIVELMAIIWLFSELISLKKYIRDYLGITDHFNTLCYFFTVFSNLFRSGKFFN